MKRCTLFLSTAGGLGPYGTFTNITTDQTSGVCRQIWHTYLNEQQGSLGSLGLCRDNLSGKLQPQLHYSAKTHSTFIIHFISARARSSFAQGQEKPKRRFPPLPPQDINVPDKWGFCPLRFVELQQTYDIIKSRGKALMGFKQLEIWLWMGKPSECFKNHTMNKTWHVFRIKWVLLFKTRY